MISRRKAIAGAGAALGAAVAGMVPSEAKASAMSLRTIRDMLLPGLRGAQGDVFGRHDIDTDLVERGGGLSVVVNDRIYALLSAEEIESGAYRALYKPRVLAVLTDYRDNTEARIEAAAEKLYHAMRDRIVSELGDKVAPVKDWDGAYGITKQACREDARLVFECFANTAPA